MQWERNYKLDYTGTHTYDDGSTREIHLTRYWDGTTAMIDVEVWDTSPGGCKTTGTTVEIPKEILDSFMDDWEK